MRALINLIFLLLLTSNCFSQERQVRLSLDVGNSNMKCITTGRFFNLSTAGVGLDIKITKFNMRFYGLYGFNTYIGLKSDVGINYVDNFAMKGHFLGGSFEAYFLDEIKKIRPYFKISFLTELKSNYKNGYISYSTFIPVKFSSPPMSTNYSAIYYGSHPYEQMFGCSFYQSTPILLNLNGGISFRIIENFRVNLSAGYSVSVLNYKNVKWTKYDDFNEMMDRSPMQKKALHSIAGQIGLNYVFSFKKKFKTEMP